jgi:hypothetical protein
MEEEEPAKVVLAPLPPLTPMKRRAFDYAALDEAMAHLDAVVRRVRRNLGVLTMDGGPVRMVSADLPAHGAA